MSKAIRTVMPIAFKTAAAWHLTTVRQYAPESTALAGMKICLLGYIVAPTSASKDERNVPNASRLPSGKNAVIRCRKS